MAALPGSLRQEPPRYGGRGEAQRARGAPTGILAAPTKESALTVACGVAEKRHQKGNEKVAEHIKEWLACLAFPESHRRRIRTTNGLWRGSTKR